MWLDEVLWTGSMIIVGVGSVSVLLLTIAMTFGEEVLDPLWIRFVCYLGLVYVLLSLFLLSSSHYSFTP